MDRTPRILMCPPDYYGIEYEINPWMNRAVASDSAESHRQWRALYDTLIELGVKVERLEPVPGLPDLVFTANAGLVYHDRFISSRFRYGVRQGETPTSSAGPASFGFSVVTLPAGLHFEGAGDALFCGETLFAGYRFRSDARSHQLGRRGPRRRGAAARARRSPILSPRYVLLSPGSGHGDLLPWRLRRLRPFRPGGPDRALIAASAEEAVTFSCNAVVVGRTVIMNEETPKLARSLRDAGYAVRPLRLTEFIKAGGSAKCLTLRLDGEEAADWKHQPATVVALA